MKYWGHCNLMAFCTQKVLKKEGWEGRGLSPTEWLLEAMTVGKALVLSIFKLTKKQLTEENKD